MTEPRARPRPRGAVFPPSDLSALLYASGSNPPHLPITLTTLDEILTDFIIESCHQAALCASYSRRQKIKVDDFKWVLQRDGLLLGRVLERLRRDKGLKEERKMMDVDGLAGGAVGVGTTTGVGELGVLAGEEVKGKRGGGKGRGKKRKGDDGREDEEGRMRKRAAT